MFDRSAICRGATNYGAVLHLFRCPWLSNHLHPNVAHHASSLLSFSFGERNRVQSTS